DELQEKLKNALGSPFASLAAPRIRIAEALSALDLGKLTVRETGLLERLGARPPEAPLHTAPETGFASDAPFHRLPSVEDAAPASPGYPAPEIQVVAERPLGAIPLQTMPAVLDVQQSTPVIETAPPPEGYEAIAAASLHPEKSSGAREHSPRSHYETKEAIADLIKAKTRDRAIDVLVQYAAQFFEYTAVFVILAH